MLCGLPRETLSHLNGERGMDEGVEGRWGEGMGGEEWEKTGWYVK